MTGKERNGAGKPVVALDIDGTMGDYHGHFLRFAEAWYGRPMPMPEDINPGLPLHQFMQTSKRTYRDCKLAYRQGGLKRSMPCYSGARGLTRAVRKAGAEVWICTTRPYLRLDNIDPDTREWLRRNGIQYDAVIYGEDKYKELVRQVGLDRIVALADDLPEMIRAAQTLGVDNIYLKSQPYNRQMDEKVDGCLRFDSMETLLTILLVDIQKWKEEQK